MGYYCWFIPKFMQVAWPLHELTSGENAGKKKAAIKWDSRCQQAFNDVKRLCVMASILTYADFTKPFKLHTDACGSGLGAVLYQTHEDGTDAVIAYASQSFSKAESHYPTHMFGVSCPQVGGGWEIPWVLVWVDLWCVHWQQFPHIHAYNSHAGCSQSSLGCQLGKLQFLAALSSCKSKYRCRCLIEGILARVYTWQFGYSPESPSCSGVSCTGVCPWRAHKPHRGLQLWSAHPGCSPGQSASCPYDLRGLVPSPRSRSCPESSHH